MGRRSPTPTWSSHRNQKRSGELEHKQAELEEQQAALQGQLHFAQFVRQTVATPAGLSLAVDLIALGAAILVLRNELSMTPQASLIVAISMFAAAFLTRSVRC